MTPTLIGGYPHRAARTTTARTVSGLGKIAALITLLLLAGSGARAHDPAAHGFSLVTFERPFPAPDFSVVDLHGTTRSLASWRGRYVLLNFWATWCPPCLAEMPSMQALHEHFASASFSVVAASSDVEGASIVQPFVNKLGVKFPILLDDSGDMARTWGAQDLPVSFLLDPQGNVIAAAKGAREWSSPQALEVIGELIAR